MPNHQRHEVIGTCHVFLGDRYADVAIMEASAYYISEKDLVTCRGCDERIHNTRLLQHFHESHRDFYDTIFGDDRENDAMTIAEMWRLERQRAGLEMHRDA